MANVNNLSVFLREEAYRIEVGQEVRLTLHGDQMDFGHRDDLAVVVDIEDNDNPPEAEICVEKLGPPHNKWDDGRYLTIWVGDFVRMFSCHESGPMVVNRDFVFKKTNLKGMGCRIVANFTGPDVFVEMEKNIGGGSCDGTGRQGHCIPIKREFLTPSAKKEGKTKGEG